MIYLGLSDAQKDEKIAEYCKNNNIGKAVVFSPAKFRPELPMSGRLPHEHVEWAEIILYKFYYRLLQEIGKDTLIVINECLRTQNRHELTYNCLRLFLQQTPHQLIFQYIPIIDTVDDFMVLFDFDTRSRRKRESFRAELLQECKIVAHPPTLFVTQVPVDVAPALKVVYDKEKHKLITNIGLKDPHTIPRNLYLIGGKTKLEKVDPTKRYIGRNNRFGLDNFQTFREDRYPYKYVVFELCHNFIDFSDFLALSQQQEIEVLVADLKVEHWYFRRYQDWLRRVSDAYSILRS